MILKRTCLTITNSCYCCLNSTHHAWIYALAWHAVISTETLNDLSSLTQPGSLLPHWVSRSFNQINSLNQEHCYE